MYKYMYMYIINYSVRRIDDLLWFLKTFLLTDSGLGAEALFLMRIPN